MYVLVIVVLLGTGAALALRGALARRRSLVAAGALLFAGTLAFFAFLSFWGEHLWFAELGYAARFWKEVLTRLISAGAGAALGGLLVFLLTLPARSRGARRVPTLLGAALGAVWGFFGWQVILRFIERVPTEQRDPILGHSTSFYLFSLPFYDALHFLLWVLAIFALAGAAVDAGLASAAPKIRYPAERVAEHDGKHVAEHDGKHVAEPAAGPGAEHVAGPGAEHVAGPGAEHATAASVAGPAARHAEAPPAARRAEAPPAAARHRAIFHCLGAIALVLAMGRWLASYHLMYSSWGVVVGPGWTDVHVRLPANRIIAVIAALVGIALFLPPVQRALSRAAAGERTTGRRTLAGLAALPALLVGVPWLLGLVALPALFQWLKVVPNELAVERPYLAHNIAFTRAGFRLHEVEVTEFPVSDRLTRETLKDNQDLLSEVRLWDPRALDAVLHQFQAIRLYYEMSGVDIDRYDINGRYRQVMLAPRELDPENLPSEHQTFVNQRFKYTHGHGVAMASAHDFTHDGQPNLLVKDIPPVSASPELAIERPEIYYGEATRGYVVTNSREPEFDYPSGSENVYTRYAGTGGIELKGLFRKLLFGWKLGGTELLVSGIPTGESRVMFRREIRERVAAVAPFLALDRDPYIVIAGGRLQWIVDAYTTSSYYPYSESFFSAEGAGLDELGDAGGRAAFTHHLRRANYVRNSVKAVVDAFDGSVRLYVFEPEDPIVQVYSRIFPGLLRPSDEMPAELRAHVRYPEDFLLAQGLVYAKYHMTDPEVFYNQEDLWMRATEKYYNDVRPVEPYYVMWRPPGEGRPEFTLILPFTPKNRQVLIGWIAGMSDGDNYGRMLAYKFPKETRVLGTQQMDTKIDQDPVLSAQLSLWSQRGQKVIRGNALVIPVADTLLYVEPIFLQADTAAYPELRVVVVMHGDRMSYASSLDAALRGLVEGGPTPAPAAAGLPGVPEATVGRAQQASESFENTLRLLGERRFHEAAVELEALSRALEELQAPSAAPDERSPAARPRGVRAE
ncbi:UPF0182 family protein [Sorangium sp. So ce854]|uniref:UPF0182 family protein n=1 Tax=Sorangium sp. So ce854 TaxID=3133322 RepID=UPI003F5DEFDD